MLPQGGGEIYEGLNIVGAIICRNESMIFRKQKSSQLQANSPLQARTAPNREAALV